MSFQVVPGCSGLMRHVQVILFLETATFQNISICKFAKNEHHGRFYYKVGPVLLQSGRTFMYHKEGQELSQSGAAFLYYEAEQVALHSTTGITKWGNYYKVGEYNPPDNRRFAPENSFEAELFFTITRKKNSHLYHRCIRVTYQPEKQTRQGRFLY